LAQNICEPEGKWFHHLHISGCMEIWGCCECISFCRYIFRLSSSKHSISVRIGDLSPSLKQHVSASPYLNFCTCLGPFANNTFFCAKSPWLITVEELKYLMAKAVLILRLCFTTSVQQISL